VRRGVLSIALAVAAVTALVATPAASAVPRSFFGIVPQTQLLEGDYARMAQGRVGTLRVILNWSAIELEPDVYNWTGYDAIVSGAAHAGVTVLPFLYGTPEWVARGLEHRRCTRDCGLFAPKGKKALLHWRDFIADAIARYGPNGAFFAENPTVPRKPIRAWQVWNEQNSRVFYKPKPSPGAYAKLLDQAAKAIRSSDPGADVVLGGMAEFRRLAAGPKVIAGSDFLDRLYRVRGNVKRDFDGVAPHPYAGEVARVIRQTNATRKVMRKHGDGRAGLWVTELGWSSSRGGNPLEVGAQAQAQRLKQAMRFFKRRANRYNVKNVSWFSWVDSPRSICSWCANSGLFMPGLVEKPAWRAFVKFTGGS
jgi:polysaccharide biosynthesis protein PslG